MKILITESQLNEITKRVKCKGCGWKWKLSDGEDDPYICHKCGHNNQPKILSEITSEDAWTNFYSDKKNYPLLNGDENLFNELNNLYPKKNNQFNKSFFNWLYSLKKNNELRNEDYYKAENYLKLFVTFFNRIPKDKRDINSYKTLPDLYDVVEPFENNEDITTSKSQELKTIKNNEVNKVFENEKWKVLIPKTKRASCLIGKGTQWCTAADQSRNYFDDYNKEGSLYIIINKEDDSKYQVHFEKEELMDTRNRPITPVHFFDEIVDHNLTAWFIDNRPDFYNFILKTSAEDVANGGYYELFYESLDNANDEDAIEMALYYLRYGDDEDSIINGFMREENPNQITNDQISNFIHNVSNGETFQSVILHLRQIGYDLDDIDNEDVNVLIKGYNQLHEYKLELKSIYSIDKGRTLRINNILNHEGEPRYDIVIFEKNHEYRKHGLNGLVTIDKLLSYLHNKSLFESIYIKKQL